MARGSRSKPELTAAEKARINAVIEQAESDTGLEFCLVVGSRPGADARVEAERAFAKLDLHDRPGVLVMVVPHARTLEVVTAQDVHHRLSNKDCDEAVRLMTGIFATGDIVGGLERGFQYLADLAGSAGAGAADHPDLPNVLDLDEPDQA